MKIKLIYLIVFLSGWLTVNAQNPPVALNDDYIPIFENLTQQFDSTIAFNVVLNDFDPDGNPVRIKEVYNTGQSVFYTNFNDSCIIWNFYGFFSVTQQMLKYRICEINDTTIVSDWAYVNINAGMSYNAPVANNDTFTAVPGYEFIFNPLLNDIDPNNDSIHLATGGQIISDSNISVLVGWDNYTDLYKGFRQINYIVSDSNPWFDSYDMGKILVKIENVDFYDSLNINNINALFNCFGNHFWDMPGGKGARFYVPNGSLIPSIFAGIFWIGGLDQYNFLHLAAERYRQVGMDFMHGPISDVYDSAYDLRWFHAWKLNKAEIENHQQNWGNTGYVCPDDILTWPGNGDVSNGQPQNLAPYFDINNNNVYEPLEGDYPLIKGDQEVFFIFNDARLPHTETEGTMLGIEIYGSAYAFDNPEDSALWNTVFMHYDIINRSGNTYHDAYMGLFTDIDLGNAWDDYVGCDVESGFYYGYNGDDYDEDYTPYGDSIMCYHDHPPAIGIQFLGGPYLNPDGIDNPSGGCDYSINGLNFGDTVVDNERMGLTGFTYFNNGGSAQQGDPSIAQDYYYYLINKWKDGSPLLYGGNGHANSGAVGPECRFMFPSDSDSCNWGTSGIMPNGGFNQNGYYWTEITAGNQPHEIRGLGSSGPFTFEPGQVQQLDIAFVFGRDFNGTALSSVDVLKQRCGNVKELFENDPGFFVTANSFKYDTRALLAYPNPAQDILYITGLSDGFKNDYYIYDITGSIIKKGLLEADILPAIGIKDLHKGLYFIKITSDESVQTIKFIKE